MYIQGQYFIKCKKVSGPDGILQISEKFKMIP